MGRKHLDIMNNRATNEYHPTSIQTLFDPGEDGHVPEMVVLQGPAGIGKNTIVQKIMFVWASENLYQDKFNYVFCVSCREINNIKGKVSLIGLISNICNLQCSENVIKSILGDSENILVIIDGLDELRWQFQNKTGLCVNPFEETSWEDIQNRILRKKVLPRASLIITTRPYTLERLEECVQSPRYVEAMGFNEKNRFEYLFAFFENKEQAERAVEIVKENETLFTMCVVPITCWIVCTVMKQQMEGGLNVANTTTSIYWLFVRSLLKYHGRDSFQSVLSCVKKLCSLENYVIREKKILFDEKCIASHVLSMSEIESIFLNENIFQRGTDSDTTYSFIHLSVQEFFAALYYVLSECTKSRYSSGPNEKLLNLIKESEFCQHLRLIVCFLFGLCSEKHRKEIEDVFMCKILIGIISTLEPCMMKILESDGINIIFVDYLYETQEEDFIRSLMSYHKKLCVYESNPNFTSISYCLMNSPRHDHSIYFLHSPINIQTVEMLSVGLMKCAVIQ
ncbi:NACHT, LRR and PYD domains-containing protein 12-like [Discoglossus pictus]